MSQPYRINITPGHVARHAPRSTQGREAALVDIAQDLLLRQLHDDGVLDLLVFKGGTALRKLYAGQDGRFSLDLDFSVRDVGGDLTTVQEMLTDAVQGRTVGPFSFGISHHRGKPTLTIATTLGTSGTLSSKLDVNPPPWLEPDRRPWVPLPIHDQYGGPLPLLPCVRLEENMAEKIARLNRTTTARDVYDLVWLLGTFRRGDGTRVDTALVRRLAVLKIWVDAHGLNAPDTHWKPGHESAPFDPDRWLRQRPARDFDREDIGQLAIPTPDLDTLGERLRELYAFLTDLSPQERQVARADAGDRTLVLTMLGQLPTTRVGPDTCW